MNTILEVTKLCAGYEGIEVLKNISFQLKEAEILAIVGESGSGKSTLIKTITRLETAKLQINSERMTFDGRDLDHLSQNQFRCLRGSQMSLICQDPTASLNPLRRIKHQFEDTIRSHERISKPEVLRRSNEMLLKMGFEDPIRVLNAFPHELSGGMNQRISIALAMVLRPRLLLADEPTSALDVTVQAQVVKELLALREEFQTAMCLITHNMGVAAHMADRIAVIQNGEMVECGPTCELIENPKHEYTKKLLRAIPRLALRPEGQLA